jgi:signal transduction histidine kinase
LATETLYYAAREIVRNAAKYARPAGETAPLRLLVAAAVEDGRLALAIEDNGRGAARTAGQGHGLELHSTLMAIAGGSLSIEASPGQMTRVCLLMPVPADRGDSATVDEIGESWQTVTSSASA